VRGLFAGHEDNVEAVMEEKRRFLADKGSSFPATTASWQAVQERLVDSMAVFPFVAEALSAAGIPAETGYLGLDASELRTSFRWANRIRPRYTVLDFLEGQGSLDDAIDVVIAGLSSRGPGS